MENSSYSDPTRNNATSAIEVAHALLEFAISTAARLFTCSRASLAVVYRETKQNAWMDDNASTDRSDCFDADVWLRSRICPPPKQTCWVPPPASQGTRVPTEFYVCGRSVSGCSRPPPPQNFSDARWGGATQKLLALLIATLRNISADTIHREMRLNPRQCGGI